MHWAWFQGETFFCMCNGQMRGGGSEVYELLYRVSIRQEHSFPGHGNTGLQKINTFSGSGGRGREREKGGGGGGGFF